MGHTSHPSQPESRGPRPLLRRLDQVAVAVILGLSGLAIGVGLLLRGYPRGRLIDIDRAEPGTIEFRVDVNRADWTELSLLPGVGETLARRIVQSRETDGPFRRHEDLRRVKGIGARTLESLEPYLLPIPAADATAERIRPVHME
jgi:competence protein ComEA